MNTYALDKFAGLPAVHPIARHHQSGTSRQTARTVFNWLKDRYQLWQKHRLNRAAFKHMLALDPKQLNDIGVTRSEVMWANSLPISQNAALELELVSRKRRMSE